MAGRLIPYASITRTRRNLAGLHAAGWHLLISPQHPVASTGRIISRFNYAIDNGAYGCWQQGEPFNDLGFMQIADAFALGADWMVIPDSVGNSTETLSMLDRWLPRLRDMCPLLIAVQDGMVDRDVEALLGPELGIFIGGTTDWKLSSMRRWGALAERKGCWLHVGRVNSRRRIRYCKDAGAHSFDGTSASRFAVGLPPLDDERRQMPLFGRLNE